MSNNIYVNEQTKIDYYAMFSELVKRHNALAQQSTDIDREIAKLNQLILATFPLLPEDKQKLFQTEIEMMEERSGGLLSAIKLVFRAHKGQWLTASQVRDHLSDMGFDLTQYRANPLASIATTLRRMVGDRIESMVVDNQTMYRRRITLLEQMGHTAGKADLSTVSAPSESPGNRLHPQERFSLEHTRPAKKER